MVARVLVVDDEDQIRRVLDHYLRAEGFEVAEAATGRDALALVATRATRPDIVLLDIGLADMTGLEVLARIRADSDLPVILVTARTEEVDTLVGFQRRRRRLRHQAVQPPRGRRPGAQRAAPRRPRSRCSHGLDLSLDLAPEPVEVEADPDRIAQVATNLVGNALRATDSGGSIVVATRSTPTGAAVTVTDTGEGLEPDQLEKVFERFYRVPGRRAPGSEVGSGIGLTIARGIARLHGGELVASSPGPGRGATFTLTLPGIRTASGGPGS